LEQTARTANAYADAQGQVREKDKLGYSLMRGLAEGQANAAAQHMQELQMEYQRVMIMLQQHQE
jgi:hypothetical protein